MVYTVGCIPMYTVDTLYTVAYTVACTVQYEGGHNICYGKYEDYIGYMKTKFTKI